MCEVPNYDKEFIRSRLRDCVFTSFRDSSKITENNLSKDEHLDLKDLIKNRDLVIQKTDKGNTVVIFNKNDYISRMEVILNDSSKFQKLSIDQNKVLNHIIHMENRITDVLKKLKKKNKNVDDTFLLFRSKDHIEKFRGCLNCQHLNIKFTSKIEEKNSISFLDIKIRRVNNSFSTNIYRKVTFSGLFTNFESFIPITYK